MLKDDGLHDTLATAFDTRSRIQFSDHVPDVSFVRYCLLNSPNLVLSSKLHPVKMRAERDRDERAVDEM